MWRGGSGQEEGQRGGCQPLRRTYLHLDVQRHTALELRKPVIEEERGRGREREREKREKREPQFNDLGCTQTCSSVSLESCFCRSPGT